MRAIFPMAIIFVTDELMTNFRGFVIRDGHSAMVCHLPSDIPPLALALALVLVFLAIALVLAVPHDIQHCDWQCDKIKSTGTGTGAVSLLYHPAENWHWYSLD